MPAIAALFILIWSTGFIIAKEIVPVAAPNLFLTARFGLATLLFLIAALIARAPWPNRREVPKHLVAGVLMQTGYLSGTYWAVGHGLPPGIMALFGALQPVLTALLAIVVLREIPTPRTWLGLLLGFGGVALVIVPGMLTHGTATFPVSVVVAAIGAVLALTVGTVVQKTSIAAADLRASATLQHGGALLSVAVLAVVRGDSLWVPGAALWGSLAWSSFVSTGVGTVLLLWMVRRGRAANVASLMLLSPPLAATETFLLFGDRLTLPQIAGFAITLVGVLLCNPVRVDPPSPRTASHPASK